jgi:hypothetical protein
MTFALIILHSSLARAQRLTETANSTRSDPYYSLENDIPAGIGTPRQHDVFGAHIRAFGGVGINTISDNETQVAMVLSALYQDMNFVFGGGYIYSSNQNNQPPFKGWYEVDALAGYALSGADLLGLGILPDKIFFSITGGIGFVSRETRWRFHRRFDGPPPDPTHFNTYEWGFGFPVQLQVSYSPFKYVGIGATAFMNINKIHTNYGVAATLQLYYF